MSLVGKYASDGCSLSIPRISESFVSSPALMVSSGTNSEAKLSAESN